MTNQQLTPQQLEDELKHHVLALCTILGLQLPVAQAPAVSYPSATKAELAAAAGGKTTVRTLNRWLQPYQTELTRMGISPKAKLLPPVAVKFICEKLEIDVSALHVSK